LIDEAVTRYSDNVSTRPAARKQIYIISRCCKPCWSIPIREIRNVLIVEDIADVAQWLRIQVAAVLTAAHIDHAYNLASAADTLSLQHYDLALVDLGLPDGEGSSFIRPFKAVNPHGLCIITTIFDDTDHLLSSLRAGADGYLLKDDTEIEFASQLAGILDGRPPLSASIARCLLRQFHPGEDSPAATLTQRETDMLKLIAKGLSIKHAAEQLGISYHTAASYLKGVYRKLQVSTRAEATLKAINLGLVNPG